VNKFHELRIKFSGEEVDDQCNGTNKEQPDSFGCQLKTLSLTNYNYKEKKKH